MFLQELEGEEGAKGLVETLKSDYFLYHLYVNKKYVITCYQLVFRSFI